MKTIDEIIDIMHSPESSDSAVLWAGSKFDALSKPLPKRENKS